MKKILSCLLIFGLFAASAIGQQNSNSVTVTVVAPPTWTINITPSNYYQSKAATMTINVTAGTVVNTCTATWDTTNLPLTFPTSLTNPVALTAAVSATMTATLGAHTVFITCPLPTLTMNSPVVLPNAQVGAAYSVSLQTATGLSGGVPPYSWTINSGSLPAGLSLSSSGVVSGVASGTGCSSCSFGFTVTDSSVVAGRSAALTWTASIGGSVPAALITGYNVYRADTSGGPIQSSTHRSSPRWASLTGRSNPATLTTM